VLAPWVRVQAGVLLLVVAQARVLAVVPVVVAVVPAQGEALLQVLGPDQAQVPGGLAPVLVEVQAAVGVLPVVPVPPAAHRARRLRDLVEGR
jgi:hypothetical protein